MVCCVGPGSSWMDAQHDYAVMGGRHQSFLLSTAQKPVRRMSQYKSTSREREDHAGEKRLRCA